MSYDSVQTVEMI